MQQKLAKKKKTLVSKGRGATAVREMRKLLKERRRREGNELRKKVKPSTKGLRPYPAQTRAGRVARCKREGEGVCD